MAAMGFIPADGERKQAGEDAESSERSGNEEENEDLSCEEEEEGSAGKVEAGSLKLRVAVSSAQTKKKKHKHRSKHKRQKHVSPEVKERRHRHKHKRHKRKDNPSTDVFSNCGDDDASLYSSSAKHPRLEDDEMALLEELEKQRALIQAELDGELTEGGRGVQSDMGLILQGYHSDEDGELQVEREHNGQHWCIGATGPGSGSQTAKDTCRGRRESTDAGKAKQSNPNKNARKSRTDGKTKDRMRGRSTSRDRDGRRHSRSSVCFRSPPGTSKQPSPPAQSRGAQNQEPSGSNHKSPEHYKARWPDKERDKKATKSPAKDASSGKENRSPGLRGRPPGPALQLQRSTSPSQCQNSLDSSSGPQAAERRAMSPSPPRGGHPRSPESRRRVIDRLRLPPGRMWSQEEAGVRRDTSPALGARRRFSRSPFRRRSRSPRRCSRSPFRRRL